ncbi:hypothetical protein EDD11_006344 [Mortierella claussenii]|nr:hypothetical protein EDD11_006344 [Mortierella claussenii]
MASVMLFPNPATHRRMPHLSKEPKETKEQREQREAWAQQQKDTLSILPQDTIAVKARSRSAHDRAPSSEAEAAAALGTGSSQSSITARGQGRALLQSSAQESKSTLSIDTHKLNSDSTAGHANSNALLEAVPFNGSEEVATFGLSGTHAAVTPQHLVLDPSTATRQEDRKWLDQEDVNQYAHTPAHQQHLSLLNGPHGQNSPATVPTSATATPLSALPPSGVASSSSSIPTMHESKTIKTALYDAFGCLYHPVQHTHHPSASSSSSTISSSSATLPHGRLSTTTTGAVAALRSGEVTPLIGISPRASPMLRPHVGPSAPITPLELSSVDGHAGGYFGLHAVSNAAANGPGTPVSTATRSLQGYHLYPQAHHHPLQQCYVQHQHNATRRASTLHQSHDDTPHLHHSPTTTSQSETVGTASLKNMSRRTSLDYNLNPTEHPVLCSLQTLSLTHPHPPEHYHPHLGHDLGHDRIPIAPAETVLNGTNATFNAKATVYAKTTTAPAAELAQPLTSVQEQSASMSTTQPSSSLASTLVSLSKVHQQQQQPVAPSELLSNATRTHAGGSSPFPMDQGQSDGPIGSMFNPQDLV